MVMPDAVYNGLKNVSWECFRCGVPNFSTSLFDTTIFDTSNTFSYLNETSESELSFNNPVATSSPTKCSPTRKDLPIRIVIVNCRSIKTPGKPAELQNLITSTNADIIVGNESWLNSDVSSAEVFPPGFQVYRKDRQKGPGGGVFLLVSNNLHSEEPEEFRHDGTCEMVWCKVKVKGSKDLYICSFYRPPDNHEPEYLETLQSYISRVPTQNGAHMWIGGDFNLPDIDWEKDCVGHYPSHATQCHQLLTITKDSFLEQMVHEPTRTTEHNSNILDLFFTNNDTLVNQVHIAPGISDHDAVFVESSLQPFYKKPSTRRIFQYGKADFSSFREDLRLFTQPFEQMACKSDVNTAWISLKAKIHELMEKYIPKKSIRDDKKFKPWINRRIRSLHRRQTKLFRRKRQSMKPSDITAYKRFRAKVQKEERQEYWRYVENIIDTSDGEASAPSKQKRFWSFIKSKRKDNVGIAPLKDNGKMHSDARDKANILNKQYESVFTHEDQGAVPLPDGEPFASMPDIQINTEGVLKLLRKINPSKASGPDMIPARILKELAEDLAPILSVFFRKTLQEGTVPDDWKQANVTAIFKKGERFKASNYRPVSLTSLCCKIQEHILTSNIMSHLDKLSILTDCQHGFRARRGCETQLITLIHELTSSLDKRSKKSRQIDMVILDFSKAFDRVPHRRLLAKLNHYGIRGHTLSWIESFLSKRQQRVIVEGATSDDVPVVSGVPQGTVLGPLLFLCFINDLPDCVDSNTRLFADDCAIYREIRDERDATKLQEDLQRLAQWELKWGMSFHPDKCNIMHITRARSPGKHSYTLKGHVLQEVSTARYLGLDIRSDLSWNTHIDRIVKKGNSMLGFLQRNLRINCQETKSSAYHALVRSNLEYCASVWNPHTTSAIYKIEMVQRRAARYTTNRYRNTSSVTNMIDSLGWESLESRRTKQQLSMMYKIVNNLVDVEAEDYLTPATTRTRKKHNRTFRTISSSTDSFKHSFFPRIIPIWNSLPAVIAEAPDLVSFREGLSSLTF